jgi:hypothetical protein
MSIPTCRLSIELGDHSEIFSLEFISAYRMGGRDLVNVDLAPVVI